MSKDKSNKEFASMLDKVASVAMDLAKESGIVLGKAGEIKFGCPACGKGEVTYTVEADGNFTGSCDGGGCVYWFGGRGLPK